MEFRTVKRDGVQIPPTLRKEMDINEGDTMLIMRDGEKIIMIKADDKPVLELLGMEHKRKNK